MRRPSRIEDLAIFGGEPAFSDVLHVGRPNVVESETVLRRLADVLDRRWLTNDGPYVRRLEATVAEWLEVEHCVAVSNATVGLEIVARALCWSGEVVVPAMTFVASAHAMKWLGLEPVLCDVDPGTHNLDPDQAARCITPRTSAVMGVHLWGRPCAPDALAAVAQESGVDLIFDAAHALGCTSNGRFVANFGRAEVFSLHATKFVNSFEGGLMTTQDGELAKELRLLRNFGFKGMDNVVSLGINAKMSEASAAMGLTQVEGRDEIIECNRVNYLAYLQELGGLEGVRPVTFDTREECNYQYVVYEVDEQACGLHRDLLIQLLHAENIKARRYFYPGLHRMKPYDEASNACGGGLPVTERLVDRVLVLPTGQSLDPAAIEEVSELIRFAINKSEEIVSKWPAEEQG